MFEALKKAQFMTPMLHLPNFDHIDPHKCISDGNWCILVIRSISPCILKRGPNNQTPNFIGLLL